MIGRFSEPSEVAFLKVAAELVPFLVGSDNLRHHPDGRASVKVADARYRELESLNLRVTGGFQVLRRRIILGIVEPIGNVLYGVAMLLKKLLEHTAA